MVSYSNSFLITYNIIFFITSIYLYYDIVINFCYVNTNKHYFIIHEVKEKRYIEYIPKIILCSKDENISPKEFAYKDYNIFCYCKNNKNYRVYDKNLCLTSKECSHDFQFSKQNYKLKYLSIWKKQKIKNIKQKYNFFQGLNNMTRKCLSRLDYKKCGFLLDLNIDFCIKNNEECPYDDINTTFYLNNLTSDIILLIEDKNIKINNKNEIKDFFPEFYVKNDINNTNYKYIDSTNLYDYVIENDIPYLKETINENTNNVRINLISLQVNKTNIKYNDDYFKDNFLVAQYSGVLSYFKYSFYLGLIIFYFIYLFCFIDIKLVINSPNEQIKSIVWEIFCKFGFEIILILMMVYLYYDNKIKNDKEYIMNDEYYLTLKSIKKIIIDLVLFNSVLANNFILIIIKHYKLIYNYLYKLFHFKNNNNNSKFVDIQ